MALSAKPETVAPTAGLIAGTMVRTMQDWRPIETLQPGDLVMTFDDGLQPLRGIGRHLRPTDQAGMAAIRPVVVIPEGVLGNARQMRVLPGQSVMVESDLGELIYGDPFTLVPAQALLGWRGIAQSNAVAGAAVVSLQFDNEQMIYCDNGALTHAPAVGHSEGVTFLYQPQQRLCSLSLAQGRQLIAGIQRQERQARPPHLAVV